MFRSSIQLSAGTAGFRRYGRYDAGTAGIFSGTKQGGQAYRIAGRYGIFRPYRPVRYGIDNLAMNTTMVTNMSSFRTTRFPRMRSNKGIRIRHISYGFDTFINLLKLRYKNSL